MEGTWTVGVSDTLETDLGQVKFAGFLEGQPRSIEVTDVSFDAVNATAEISLSAMGASDEAVVSLFIDSDRSDFDGMLVDAQVMVQGNGDGSTVIDTTGLNLPSGEYFVYAQLEDPAKPVVLSEYFVNGFIVTDPEQLPRALECDRKVARRV